MSRAVPCAFRPRRLTVSVLQALAVPSMVLLTASAAWAGCSTVAPVTGQTVTCDANAPNPQTVPVAATGAAGITVNVASTAQLQQSGGGSAISLVGAGGHLLSNLGTISSVGGVAVQLGGGSRVESSGSISTGNNIALQFVGAGDSVLVNSGTISGRTGVQFDAGNDRLEMQAGSITGGVLQGDGNDVLVLGNGTIDSVDQGSGDDQMTVTGGTVTGVVAQGSGRDDFVMSGGTIGALQQGDNIDTFRMSGGRIVGAFEDGDQAWMTAGRIGRVNMKLDKNLWDQSGGTVDGNVVTGFDTDTIIISGTAYIGGNISVSGGNDSVTITDGTVRGQVLLSTGDDTFNWSGGGIVYGAIDMGPDNDVANLSNLNQGNLGAVPLFDGGSGIDQLNLSNVKTAGVGRYQNWETISLANSTELSFDGDLVLGDSVTGTGTLTVDDTSTVYAGSGGHAIRPFNSAALVEMINAGRIDLTGTGAGDVFTVRGNYRGDGGGLYLRTVLGADNSPSDRLVIDGGTATGTTGIGVLNAGGSGAATLADGILVVQALNGGRTAPGAFSLFAPVAAGAYEYFLFKGGVSAGTQRWWQRHPTAADAAGGTTASHCPGAATAARRRHRSGPDRRRDRTTAAAAGTGAGGTAQRSGGAGRAGGRRCAARNRCAADAGCTPGRRCGGTAVPRGDRRLRGGAAAAARDLAGQPRYLPRAAGRTAPAVQPGRIPHRLGPPGGAEQRDPLEGRCAARLRWRRDGPAGRPRRVGCGV